MIYKILKLKNSFIICFKQYIKENNDLFTNQ